MKSIIALLTILLIVSGCSTPPATQSDLPRAPAVQPDIRSALPPGEPFRFTVCGDSRPTGSERKAFQWTLHEMTRLTGGEGAFLVMVGDFDPPEVTDEEMRAGLGHDALWYPVVGNHEAETPGDMAWVRDRTRHLPFIVRQGPLGSETTTYSFDYGSAHFVVLNEYFDGQRDHAGEGDVGDLLYDWLKEDLEATQQPVIFVAGHEPAYPKHRHVGNSLDADPGHRDRFWKLLNERGVAAYFTGHTHTYGRMQQGAADWAAMTWQVDAGNCGQGGSQTFIDVSVTDAEVRFDVYGGARGRRFTRIDSWTHTSGQGAGIQAGGSPSPAVSEIGAGSY